MQQTIQVKLDTLPSWIEECFQEDFKARNIDPLPAWKFVKPVEAPPFFPTLDSKLSLDFQRKAPV